MTFYDECRAAALKLGLDPDDRTVVPNVVPVGNGVTQFQTSESTAGTLVRRMEQHLGLTSTGLLGARLRQVLAVRSPLAKVKGKTQIILFGGFYTPALCRLHPDLLFVFGDNGVRVGNGGQACIRPEPNAIGVATKRAPGSSGADFFCDGNAKDMGLACLDVEQLDRLIAQGKRIVLPVTAQGRISLGVGLSELPYRAPLIYAFIEAWFRRTCIANTHEFIGG